MLSDVCCNKNKQSGDVATVTSTLIQSEREYIQSFQVPDLIFPLQMPQTVPSAGFTPPCDYSNFAENFDLSLLPGGDQPVSPSTLFYTQSPPPVNAGKSSNNPKIYTTFYPNLAQQKSQTETNIDLGPDFQTLLVSGEEKKTCTYPRSPVSNIYLEVPSPKSYPNSPVGALSPYSPQSQGLLSPNDHFTNYRQSGESTFYPSSPEQSLYTASPSSVYSRSPCNEDYVQSSHYVKSEAYSNCTSPLPNFSPFKIKEESYSTSYASASPELNLDLLDTTVLEKQIKQESTVDFGNILQGFQSTDSLRQLLEEDLKKPEVDKPKDHQLLREVLNDTSFQKKFNIRPIDFGFVGEIKMEEPEGEQSDLSEQIARENIEPVLNLAIEQMRKDVDSTCATLGISADPSQWDAASVLSWIRWTSRQFGLPEPVSEQWDMPGPSLVALSEEDFTRRAPQGGMILHAQLEIWKAAYSEEDLRMQWLPETTSSNASSGDVSDDDEEESGPAHSESPKPTTSRSGSHIHLWQFLKELLASPQTHGSCIRWLDRSKGIFKIEDSVKVARLWGKRKNRPAMNYDKLSRSIRQYYKKGIMKKTERSQRLVYQFCHPYNL
ncbi:hypothetical protein NQ315_002164 [Exocentrus adspersus]|uniref:DNA-binding protein D-ETS-4 n=1 Tax=Exocentrus adspersus TaxID=1586481 RepID=A0AAV8VYW4_9CUCU|nr:hypothetical protein NQ315_002164 [Exocentrus adspersus]